MLCYCCCWRLRHVSRKQNDHHNHIGCEFRGGGFAICHAITCERAHTWQAIVLNSSYKFKRIVAQKPSWVRVCGNVECISAINKGEAVYRLIWETTKRNRYTYWLPTIRFNGLHAVVWFVEQSRWPKSVPFSFSLVRRRIIYHLSNI